MCLLKRSENEILHFDPNFPQTGNAGPIFDGTENFAPKSLNNGDAHL